MNEGSMFQLFDNPSMKRNVMVLFHASGTKSCGGHVVENNSIVPS